MITYLVGMVANMRRLALQARRRDELSGLRTAELVGVLLELVRSVAGAVSPTGTDSRGTT